MKKIILLLLSIFASVSFATEPRSRQLTVILDAFPNPNHAPLIIAEQQGFFKEQGLHVDLIGPADPMDPPKWVASGKADIGITYEPQLMKQIDQGLPLIRIGTLIDKPLHCLVTLKDSGIKTFADLKGKYIGSNTDELPIIMLKVMLAKQSLTDKKNVELINVRYNLTQALLSKKVDAVTGLMRNFEVPQLESNGYKITVFFPEEHGIPNYSELVFVVNTAHIYDDRLPRFLTAVKKAVAYLDTHPRETWQEFTKQYPEANNEVNREAWFATMPYFAEDPASFDREEWEDFARFMRQHRLIRKIQPVARYAVALR